VLSADNTLEKQEPVAAQPRRQATGFRVFRPSAQPGQAAQIPRSGVCTGSMPASNRGLFACFPPAGAAAPVAAEKPSGVWADQ